MIASFLFCAALAGEAAAQEEADDNAVSLDGGASHGAVTANVAAGNQNQQANVGVVALGAAAISAGTVAQSTVPPQNASSGSASVTLKDGAFAGSSGWLAANAVAGSANQQANINVMAIGIEGQLASTALLSQTRAPAENAPADAPADAAYPASSVNLGEGAFEGSAGLVQLSLVAGDRNSTANVFALALPNAHR